MVTDLEPYTDLLSDSVCEGANIGLDSWNLRVIEKGLFLSPVKREIENIVLDRPIPNRIIACTTIKQMINFPRTNIWSAFG